MILLQNRLQERRVLLHLTASGDRCHLRDKMQAVQLQWSSEYLLPYKMAQSKKKLHRIKLRLLFSCFIRYSFHLNQYLIMILINCYMGVKRFFYAKIPVIHAPIFPKKLLSTLIMSAPATNVPTELPIDESRKTRSTRRILLRYHPFRFVTSSCIVSISDTFGLHIIACIIPVNMPTPMNGQRDVIGAPMNPTSAASG